MNTKEFLQKRKGLLNKKKKNEEKINIEWTEITKRYIADNCQYKVNQVINVGKGQRARRLVIYSIDALFIEDHVILNVYGWYLDNDNNPIRWEGNGIAVAGISNPQDISISENQTANPVGDQ